MYYCVGLSQLLFALNCLNYCLPSTDFFWCGLRLVEKDPKVQQWCEGLSVADYRVAGEGAVYIWEWMPSGAAMATEEAALPRVHKHKHIWIPPCC